MKRFILFAALLALPADAPADAWEDEEKVFLGKFRSNDPKVREAAVRALQQHRTEDGVNRLVDLYLAETDAAVQQAFVEVIGGVIEGKARVRFYEHCRRGRTPEVRARLVAILGRGGFRDTFEELKGLLRDGEAVVRVAALEAVKATNHHSLEPQVRALLGDAEPAVRAACARVLGAFRLPAAGAALVGSLEAETDAQVKAAMGDALGEISGQKFGADVEAWKAWLDGQKGLRVTQSDVDRALDKAAAWIIGVRPNGYAPGDESLELELYALIHAGVAPDHDLVKSAVAALYKEPMTRVYRVGLAAMVLRDISPSIHQKYLARAAQFLVDNQCENGQWAYGEAQPGDTPSEAPPIISGGKAEIGGGTKALKRVPVRRHPKRKFAKTGDNSNTQYAVLGLRACAEAGIDIPRETWLDCLGFLKQFQDGTGGFGYNATWPGVHGSIHTSALGAYIVCRYYGGFGTKKDGVIEQGLKWMAEHFAVDENPKRNSPREWLYYYLYGMERIGVLSDTEFFGKHEWYQEGARYLLSQQKPGGDWNNDAKDTAWAILFLRRATRPVGKVEDK